MFKNIGNKLKTIARIYCYVGVIFCALLGIAYIFSGIYDFEYGLAILGVFVLIFGPLLSWVYSCFLYGFGQLIENTNKKEIAEDSEENKISLSDLAAFLEDEEKRKAFEEFYKNNK